MLRPTCTHDDCGASVPKAQNGSPPPLALRQGQTSDAAEPTPRSISVRLDT